MGKKADEYIASRVNSVIGRGTEFEGTIRTKETIRVEGFVKGNIISEGTVIIGNGGNVDGKIEATNILVGGEVHGELYASEKIEANSSGRIFGNLHTKGLIVDEKALFQGTCEMTGREEAGKEKEAPKEAEEAKETA
ncbi:MAG: polymer-forming cytoskeletal protein [Lachnospiraceae bacterium]|nr:polymer-forming cytoskeletal protein [Lachnospiraceae bacterium]